MAVKPEQSVQDVKVRKGKRQRFERRGVEKRARISGTIIGDMRFLQGGP